MTHPLLSHAEVRAVNELLWRRGANVGPETGGHAGLRGDVEVPQDGGEQFVGSVGSGVQAAPAGTVEDAVLGDGHLLRMPDAAGELLAGLDIAALWPKAEAGTLTPGEAQRFHRLMAHEYVESSLMNRGMPYRSTHPSAWDPVLGNRPTPQHHGAHDLAPHVDPARDPFGHWERSLGRDHPGVTEIAPDLSNLDDIIHRILDGGR